MDELVSHHTSRSSRRRTLGTVLVPSSQNSSNLCLARRNPSHVMTCLDFWLSDGTNLKHGLVTPTRTRIPETRLGLGLGKSKKRFPHLCYFSLPLSYC